MKCYKYLNSKAVSLIELVIALGIIGLVIAGMFALFLFGNSTFSWGNIQYNLQSDMRLASDEILKRVRYSTEANLLVSPPTVDSAKEGYSYIYLSGTNDQVIHAFKKNGTLTETLFQVNDMILNLDFINPDTQILGMRITAQSINDTTKTFDVSNEAKIMNLHLGIDEKIMPATITSDYNSTTYHVLEYRTPEYYIESQLPLEITAFSSASQNKIITIDFNKVVTLKKDGLNYQYDDPNNLNPLLINEGFTSLDDGAPSRVIFEFSKKPNKNDTFTFYLEDFYTTGYYVLTFDTNNKWVYSDFNIIE